MTQNFQTQTTFEQTMLVAPNAHRTRGFFQLTHCNFKIPGDTIPCRNIIHKPVFPEAGEIDLSRADHSAKRRETERIK